MVWTLDSEVTAEETINRIEEELSYVDDRDLTDAEENILEHIESFTSGRKSFSLLETTGK